MACRVPERRRAALALALFVPAPTLGALAAFVLFPGPLGSGLYFAAKAWILVVPLWWRLRVERAPLSLSPIPAGRRGRDLGLGLLLGLVLGAIVLAAHLGFGHLIVDRERLLAAADEAGFATPARFVAFAAYLVLVNSLLEEYVWRWFVVARWADLVPARAAVFLASLSFTLHHCLAFAVQLGPVASVVASLAVFVAGCLWSWCYLRLRSIWPGYVSHVIVDLVGLAIGWRLIFG